MTTTPVPRCRAESAVGILAVLGGVLLLAACASPPPPTESKEVRPIGRQATDHYNNALQAWVRARAVHLEPGDLDAAQLRAIAHLENAVRNAPKCLLFHTKIADLQLERNQPVLAKASYKRTLELCPDWTLGWLGLARLANAEGRPDVALQYLEGAQWSVVSLERWGAPPDPGIGELFLGLLGISLPPTPPQRDFFDPGMEPEAAKKLVRKWTEAALEWSPANTSLVRDGGPPESSRDVTNRLKARMLYLGAYSSFLLCGGQNRARLLADLDRALEHDPEFFEARVVKADLLMCQGDARGAYAFLATYLRERNPMLAHHDALVLLLMRTLLARAAGRLAPDALPELGGFVLWLSETHGRPQRPVLGLAQDIVLANERKDGEALATATARLQALTPGNDRERRIKQDLAHLAAGFASQEVVR